MRMRVLIQNRSSQLYFKGHAHWTGDAAEAQDFETSAAAINHAVSKGLNNVQVVLKFHHTQYDIMLPVAAQGAAENKAAPPPSGKRK